MHWTKCLGVIINVLAPFLVRNLKDDICIGTSKFSLLINKSTDISVSKYLDIVAIYFGKKLFTYLY